MSFLDYYLMGQSLDAFNHLGAHFVTIKEEVIEKRPARSKDGRGRPRNVK